MLVRGGDKPGSVAHSRGVTVISLGRTSPRASSDHPGGHRNGPFHTALSGLAPDGVYQRSPSPGSLVRSYRTVSP